MRLNDALFNWLQIRVVADARPNDRSAEETVRFFREILSEDHGVTDLSFQRDQNRYVVRFTVDGQPHTREFDSEAVEQLLIAIENEPRYN